MTGILNLKLPDGGEVVTFRYKVVRARATICGALLAG